MSNHAEFMTADETSRYLDSLLRDRIQARNAERVARRLAAGECVCTYTVWSPDSGVSLDDALAADATRQRSHRCDGSER